MENKNIKSILNECVECKLCLKKCKMLQKYCSTPKELFSRKHIETLVPYSCNLCKSCEKECPENLKISEAFMELRKKKVLKNNGKSPLKGHSSIHMHQMFGFSKIFNKVIMPKGMEKVKRVFMPGCSLCAYNPELVLKTYNHLKSKFPDTALLIGCCGKPTESLGEEEKFKEIYMKLQHMIDKTGAEEVITACQSCFLTVGEYSPNQKVKSLWNVLKEIGLPEASTGIGKNSDITFCIHDSCPTRNESEIHNSVRWIMEELSYSFVEMKNSREKTRCCGAGGMVPSVNPVLAINNMLDTAKEAENNYIVTYCASCRQSMITAEKKSLHILDLIFKPTWKKSMDIPGKMGAIESWKNRFYTIKMIK